MKTSFLRPLSWVLAGVLLGCGSSDSSSTGDPVDGASGTDTATPGSDARLDSSGGIDTSTPIDSAASDTATAGDTASTDTASTDTTNTDAPGDGTAICAAQEATGVGDCKKLLGVFWNGTTCVSLSGCSCSGKDCGRGFADMGTCNEAVGKCDCRVGGCPGSGSCQLCKGASGPSYVCLPAGAVC